MVKAGFEEIKKFIVENVTAHPRDITRLTASKFSITRQAVLRHLNKLISDGTITVEGKTKDRAYFLAPFVEQVFIFNITPELSEDKIWRENVRPLFKDVAPNVLGICQYGFTEMMNNAIDHSEGNKVTVLVTFWLSHIMLQIVDNGIGIFKKIQTKLGLDDARHAILELSKGKLTTDPAQHTGEGIFFTSRMFDTFIINSDNLALLCINGEDWLLEQDKSRPRGTTIVMQISPYSTRTSQSVFDQYTNADDEFGFAKTTIPVKLSRYGDENLVSRSQAKRLLARIERFREVIFDFKDVEMIGQAFADEVYRVFQNRNPHIHLMWSNANQQVERMILHARNQPAQDVNG
ncbi:MAG: STAS-like domain-containing protein [Anaerolineales bacterium]